MDEKDFVLVEKNKGIATITMNRPKSMNSLHPLLMEGLVKGFLDAEEDPEIKVIVLTGAGKAFSAGGDLPYIETITDPFEGRKYIVKGGSITSTIMSVKKPVIAMVNGVAAGAGFNLMLACDIVFSAKSARFAQSFAKVGLIPDCGGTYLLPRVVGLHKAKELMYTGKLIKSDEAFRLGLVNQVVEDEELKDATYKFAEELVNSAPLSLGFIKEILNQSGNMTLENVLELEADLQSLCLLTEDNKEGVKAFKEKRAPEFKGK